MKERPIVSHSSREQRGKGKLDFCHAGEMEILRIGVHCDSGHPKDKGTNDLILVWTELGLIEEDVATGGNQWRKLTYIFLKE